MSALPLPAPLPGKVVLQVRDLHAWYGESHILHGIDFEVREGEVVTLLGRNILQLKNRGYTVVLVEQNFRFAAPLADRHCVIEHGRIVETVDGRELDAKKDILDELLGV